MKNVELDLNEFSKDTDFYSEIKLVITIKSFDLQAIRLRYLNSKKNVSGKAGSVERRAVSKGGVAKVTIENGRLNEVLVIPDLQEPRGIDYKSGRFAISLENLVYIYNGDKVYNITNPWFSYIHTVDLNKEDVSKVLVTSSGYECLMEYDYIDSKKTWEWFAWDNGLDEANNPKDNSLVKLTRSLEQASLYQKENINHLLIDDPENQDLPTAKRAAFINTARYDDQNPEYIFATLFHEGSVRYISKESGSHKIVLDKMKSPHGGHRFAEDQTICTNTGGGTVELLNNEERLSISFINLPNKPEGLEGMEWLQNSIRYESYIITIDSNRNSLVIIDLELKKYDLVPYNMNWAVQDMVAFDENNEPLIDKALNHLKKL